jgi:predicted GNAT family acetyltransferase
MVIKRKQTDNKGLFYGEEDGSIVAELSYTISSRGIMVIEHTEVNEAMRGKGYGRQLVEHAVAYARANNLKIIPYCPFAKAISGKTPEWQDVIYHPGSTPSE